MRFKKNGRIYIPENRLDYRMNCMGIEDGQMIKQQIGSVKSGKSFVTPNIGGLTSEPLGSPPVGGGSPTFVQKTVGNGESSSCIMTEPAGVDANDILLAWIWIYKSDRDVTLADWTNIVHVVENTNNEECTLWWVRRGASAPNLTASWGISCYYNWSVTAWDGCVATGNPYSDVQATSPMVSRPAGLPNCPAVATGVNNTTVVAFGFSYTGDATWTMPTGYSIAENGATNNSLCVGYKAVASAGSEDPAEFTTGASSAGYTGEATIALKP